MDTPAPGGDHPDAIVKLNFTTTRPGGSTTPGVGNKWLVNGSQVLRLSHVCSNTLLTVCIVHPPKDTYIVENPQRPHQHVIVPLTRSIYS